MADLGEHGIRNAEQEAHYAQLKEQRGRLDGLYGTLTLHRELAGMMLEIGRFYRTAATVPDRYREAATLAVANETKCAYVWSKHEPTARTSGMPQDAIEALRAGPWPLRWRHWRCARFPRTCRSASSRRGALRDCSS